MENKIVFYHSPFVKKGKPRLTFCGELKDLEINFGETIVINVAVARCSRKDLFNKAKGRRISQGRVEKGVLLRKIYCDVDHPIKDFIEICKLDEKKIIKNSVLVHGNS